MSRRPASKPNPSGALRVVDPGEAAPKSRRAKTVAEAADAGSTREMLVAMQTRIAKAVDDPNTAARDLASLTKRLVEVTRDIEAIDVKDSQETDSGETGDESWQAI